MYSIRLPYPPSANRLWRHFNGRTVKSAEAREYQKAAHYLVKQVGAEVLDGAVSVSVTLHPRAPKKRTRAMVRSIDLDNAQKIALDALNGAAWEDDRQIEDLHAKRGEPVEGGALVVEWAALDG